LASERAQGSAVGIGMEGRGGLELNTMHRSHADAFSYRESSEGSLLCELRCTREHAGHSVTYYCSSVRLWVVGGRDREYVGRSVGVQDGCSVGDSVGSTHSATANVNIFPYRSQSP
jgi:hypothetical protein